MVRRWEWERRCGWHHAVCVCMRDIFFLETYWNSLQALGVLWKDWITAWNGITLTNEMFDDAFFSYLIAVINSCTNLLGLLASCFLFQIAFNGSDVLVECQKTCCFFGIFEIAVKICRGNSADTFRKFFTFNFKLKTQKTIFFSSWIPFTLHFLQALSCHK